MQEAVEEVESAKAGHVKDVVCPVCFKSLPWPTVMPGGIDRYRREIRTYFAWCFECDRGFCTVQFKRDDRWAIHKYQTYRQYQAEVELIGDWIVLNELPDPASIVLGPGGDFDRHIELKNTKSPGGPLGEALAFLKKNIDSKGAG